MSRPGWVTTRFVHIDHNVRHLWSDEAAAGSSRPQSYRVAGDARGCDHPAWAPRGLAGPGACPIRRSGPGEVRIAVKAAGINFADTLARIGLYPDAPKLPCVVGYEVAGEIESVGEGVDSHKVGDRVVAGTRFNGQAELVTVAADHGVPAAQEVVVRGGRRVPRQLRHRLRGAGDHGRPEEGRAGADPRRGRRRGNRGDAGRSGDRGRDLRHRVGLQARRDPRAGSRARDRLPEHGLRAGGAEDHRRAGAGRGHGCPRPDLVPQGLQAAAARAGG